jgi:hypothetical protein
MTVRDHLKSVFHQEMEGVQGESRAMAQALAFGGQKHRESTVDSFLLAYFIMKEKLPHTTAEKLKEVLPHLHFCDAEAVSHVPMSRETVARFYFYFFTYFVLFNSFSFLPAPLLLLIGGLSK